jgi:hypothetical protein
MITEYWVAYINKPTKRPGVFQHWDLEKCSDEQEHAWKETEDSGKDVWEQELVYECQKCHRGHGGNHPLDQYHPALANSGIQIHWLKLKNPNDWKLGLYSFKKENTSIIKKIVNAITGQKDQPEIARRLFVRPTSTTGIFETLEEKKSPGNTKSKWKKVNLPLWAIINKFIEKDG